MVAVLRAQGALGPEKRKLLQDMAAALNIPLERHKAEIRKAVNDEKLNTIAEVYVFWFLVTLTKLFLSCYEISTISVWNKLR